MRSPTLLALTTILLPLSACAHRRGDPHDDDVRGEPGERHAVDDSATDSAADTAADTSADTSSDTAADTATDTDPTWSTSTECADAALRFTGARLSVDPASLAPGATFALTVTLQNASGADDMAYPGVLFASSDAAVTTTPGSDWLYGLFAGQENELGANFVIAPDAAAPLDLVVTATTTRLGCEHGESALPDGTACPAACVLRYPLTIPAAR